MINFTGLDYIKIDVANQVGLGKKLFEERINWVDLNEHQLEQLIDTADDPYRYAAAVMAFRNAQAGIPSGHMVGFDACASGPQIMSAMMGCITGARNTGLIGDTRQDFYANSTEAMNKLLPSKKVYSPKIVKKATMTSYYGSVEKPKNLFGEGTSELEAFYKSRNIVAPGAVKLINLGLNAWQPNALSHSWIMPDNFNVIARVLQVKDSKIEVDELDHATFMYRHSINKGTKKGVSLIANIVHSGDGFVNRELNRRCNYNLEQLEECASLIKHQLSLNISHTGCDTEIEVMYKQSGFTSLVGVEYINELNVDNFGKDYLEDLLSLIEDTLEHKSFPVITVHDEFMAHANNMNKVRKTYIEVLAEIAESTMIDHILTEITGTDICVPKLSDNLGALIRKAEYPLS